MWLVSAFAILCGVLFLQILKRYVKWIMTPLWKIPGPKSSFLWGEFLTLRKEAFGEPSKRWWKEAGYDVPMLHYTSVMGFSYLLILDKEIAREILSAPAGKKDYRFGRDGRFLASKIGEGLISLQGPQWMRHRQIIQPAFQARAVKEALTASVPPLVSKFIEYWSMAINNNKEEPPREIDLASHLSALTLDVIGQVAFSHEFHAIESVKQWANNQNIGDDKLDEVDDPFIKAMSETFKYSVLGTVTFLSGTFWVDKYLNPRNTVLRRHLDGAVDAIVENARNNNSSERPKSLLQFLLQAEENHTDATSSRTSSVSSNRTLNNAELRDEMKTFIIAGHGTTQTLLYWAIYAMAKLPDIQERVYQDISHTKKKGEQEPLDLETVEEMEYFNAFLNEVQRMYPAVGTISRETCFEEKFAGYQIPARTNLFISPYLLHRHPKYWKDPESFQPERWIHKDNAAHEEFMAKIRFAFIPFSVGSRVCIGQRFATIEAKLILVSLVQAFSFQIAPSQRDTEFTLTRFITTKTKPLLKVSVKSR
jgi:cytochrome P450